MRPTSAIVAAGLALAAAPAAGAATVQEYPIGADAGASGIVAGPDGAMWFAEADANAIGRIGADGGGYAERATAPDPEAVASAAGSLWTADAEGNAISQIPPIGLVVDHALSGDVAPSAIAAGPDGNLWFTGSDSNTVDRFSPVSGTVTKSVTIPTADSDPEGIAAGPDGNLWFTESDGNKIGRVTPAGAVTEFPLPNADSVPQGIVAGPDGNVWFAELGGDRIGRITPTGQIAEFPVPGSQPGPGEIAPGPDGNLWFTEENGDQIGRITPAGVIATFPIPDPSGDKSSDGIAPGPDGRMWFTEIGADAVGALSLDPPSVITGGASDVTQTTATISGTVDPHSAATSAHFEYGTTTAYGSTTPARDVGAREGPVALSAPLAGLRPGATYHYRLVAASPVGTTPGADATFTASSSPAPPPPKPAPALTGFAATFTCIRYPASGAPAPPSGRASFAFTLSEPATVTLSIQRRLDSGPRSRCPRARPRGQAGHLGAPIVVSVPSASGPGHAEVGPVGTLVSAGAARHRHIVVRRRVRGGRVRLTLAQATGDAPLAPGTYVASAVATTADGRRAGGGAVKFWVLARR